MICFETWVGCGVMADIFVYSLKDGLVFFDTWLGPAQAKIVMVTCWHSHLLALKALPLAVMLNASVPAWHGH